MLIGAPKEIKVEEYRVGLVPGSVRELAHHGHRVTIETNAGGGIGCTDDDYRSPTRYSSTLISLGTPISMASFSRLGDDSNGRSRLHVLGFWIVQRPQAGARGEALAGDLDLVAARVDEVRVDPVGMTDVAEPDGPAQVVPVIARG